MSRKISPTFCLELCVLIGLIGLTYVCYAKTLNADFLHSWDDNFYVKDNTLIQALNPATLGQIWSQPHYWHYIPITLMSYAIDYHFWALHPFGYHLSNLIIHALNGILVYLLCVRLQGSSIAAALAAGLFVVHPLQVETVVWISERKNLLSFLFFLLAFLAHTALKHGDESAAPWRRWTRWLAWGSFLLAVLSKAIVVCTPILFIVYDMFWARRGLWKSFTENLPYLLMALWGAAFGVLSHQGSTVTDNYWGDSFWLNAMLMLRVAWEYLISLIAPLDLNNLYIYPVDMIQGDA